MFDDQCISIDQNDNQPQEDNLPSHVITIDIRRKTNRGTIYSVIYHGHTLISETYNPELDACRALLRKGLTGKVTAYRSGSAAMVLDIMKAALLDVRENRYGTPVFVRYREGH